MPHTLRSHSGVLVGLAATAGGFAALAVISAAGAPIARADAVTDIINAVDGDFTYGQEALTNAFADLSSNDLTPGLAALFDGVDDDLLGAPDNLFIGTVEALTNETVSSSFDWGFPIPANFADAVSAAQSFITEGEGYLSDAVTGLTSGEYGDAALVGAFGVDFLSVIPLEDLLLGAAASL